MNIQLFMGKKNFDCQKAERWFKERRIKVQFMDMKKRPLSKGELESVLTSVGLKDALDTDSKAYMESPARFSVDPGFIKGIVLENQALLKTPIVRNGKKATVGFCPEVWQRWIDEGM